MSGNGVKGIYEIPDMLWEHIKPLLPPELPRSRSGRPRMDDRKAMEAILYLLHTEFRWKELPRSMGASSTVNRRFQEWRMAGVFQRMWQAGILTYDELRELIWHGSSRPKTWREELDEHET